MVKEHTLQDCLDCNCVEVDQGNRDGEEGAGKEPFVGCQVFPFPILTALERVA